MSVTHNFVSTKPPSSDPTQVGSAEWNDDHVVTFGTGAGDIAEGNHAHTGVYVPIGSTDFVSSMDTNWIDLTDGGATTLHSHAGGTWGSITGTLSDQTDLNTALNARLVAASNLSDLVNAGTARTNLGLVAGGAGDIWVEKAGDTMTGSLQITVPTATLPGLILKSSDNSTTNKLIRFLDSADAPKLLWGWRSSTTQALWLDTNAVSPSTSNYAIMGLGTSLYINVPNGGILQIGNAHNLPVIAQITKDGATWYVSQAIGVSTAQTSTPAFPFSVIHSTTGTPTTGFGVGYGFILQSSTTGNQLAGRFSLIWADATHATRRSKFKFAPYSVASEVVGLEVEATATAGETLTTLMSQTATNNAVLEVGKLLTQVSSGAGANGLGVALGLWAETATAGTDQQQAQIAASWIDATNATRKAKLSLSAYDTAARLGIEIEADGSVAKLGFYGVATVVRPTALTTQLTTVTFTAPGTPDYAIQDLIDSSAGAAFGFATKDEGNTVLSVIANLQTRVGELETKLQALGLLT